MNYYRRYLGDYMRDTMHLSITEHGAYNLLLDAQYATEKALPEPYEALNRLCRAMTPAEREAVKSVADQFFPVGSDGRWNPRARREVGIAQSTITKQRQSGVESAERRWSTDRSTHESTDAEAIQPPTTNHQPPTASPQPPTSKKPKPRSRNGTAPAAFDVPDWVPRDQWNAWIDARKKKRNPPTPFALSLAVAKLEELKEQGHAPAAVLAQSAFNGWTDLYPVKEMAR